MSGILRRPAMPAVSKVDPLPEVVSEESEDDVRKRQRRKGGRRATIVTGDLKPQSLGRKTLLG